MEKVTRDPTVQTKAIMSKCQPAFLLVFLVLFLTAMGTEWSSWKTMVEETGRGTLDREL